MSAKRKIMFVFGTRPEAVKLAPVIKAVENEHGALTAKVVTTGQHREMLDQVLDVFKIAPDHDLNIMEEDQTVEATVVKCLQKLAPVMSREKPDMVLVQGDTSTTFAASLTAYYHKVPVGHVEAGLRTFDRYNPFPEEMNRKLTTAIAELHFTPTQASKTNLLSENVPAAKIFMTGNTVIDALFEAVKAKVDLSKRGLTLDPARKTVLVTIHRRESFGEPLNDMLLALKELANKYADSVDVIFPVHRNPKVKGPVNEILGGVRNVVLLEPLDYLSFVHLMKASYIILTDSGGIQEEAPSLGVPVLVLREVTERPEGVAAGCVKVVGTDKKNIVMEASRLIDNAGEHDRMSRAKNPYGDGRASERIVKILLDHFGVRKFNRNDVEFYPGEEKALA